MNEALVEQALVTLSSILFVVDPWGAIPAFLVMSAGDAPEKRRKMAIKASIAAFVVLTLFAWSGGFILRLFGVTMPAFRIAGGLVLFLAAFEMVRAQRTTREGPGEVEEGKQKEDAAITPLAVPMLAGPASLATVTLLISQSKSWLEAAVVYLAIALACVVTVISLVLASSLYRWLGATGIHVLSRILGLVLMAIAVQFVLDGLRAAELGAAAVNPPAAAPSAAPLSTDR